MSGRIFQSVIVQTKEATGRAVGVVDLTGIVVASSDLSLIGKHLDDMMFQDAGAQTFTVSNRTVKRLDLAGTAEHAVFVDGVDEVARIICEMSAVTLREAKRSHDEKYNKLTFFKHVLSHGFLPDDISVSAKELKIPVGVPRAVFLIRAAEDLGLSAVEIIQNLFPDRNCDFVVPVAATEIVLIKPVDITVENEQLLNIAVAVKTALEATLSQKIIIGIGEPAKHLRELLERYKEAQVAIEVGKVFEPELTIAHYGRLGIGRIIHQLPITLCEVFLGEMFNRSALDFIDKDLMFTINMFFENNLNVSETSRKLFVHRNTLVYRLDKVKKNTGLDLREFDDAIKFKLGMMVKKYLEMQQGKAKAKR